MGPWWLESPKLEGLEDKKAYFLVSGECLVWETLPWHILILPCDWITQTFPKSESKAALLGGNCQHFSLCVSWCVNETWPPAYSVPHSSIFLGGFVFCSWCVLGDNCRILDFIYLPNCWASLLFVFFFFSIFPVVPVLFIQRTYLVISIYLHLILLNVLRIISKTHSQEIQTGQWFRYWATEEKSRWIQKMFEFCKVWWFWFGLTKLRWFCFLTSSNSEVLKTVVLGWVLPFF